METPFAQGTFRWVAMGHYTNGPRKDEKCVCKWFKTGAVFEESFFEMDLKAVDKPQEIIDIFNKEGIIGATQKIFLKRSFSIILQFGCLQQRASTRDKRP